MNPVREQPFKRWRHEMAARTGQAPATIASYARDGRYRLKVRRVNARVLYVVDGRQRRGWLTHDVMMILIRAAQPLDGWEITRRYCAKHGGEPTRSVWHVVRRIMRCAVAAGRARRLGRGTNHHPFRFEAVEL